MNCPACNNLLTTIAVGDVAIDVCRDGCAGIWFDQGELKKLKASDPTTAALNEVTFDPTVTVDLKPRRHCPKCAGSVLMRHFSSATRAVTIDECPTCAGVWLDHGELQRILDEYASGSSEHGVAALLETALMDDRMELLRGRLDQQSTFETTWWSRILSAIVAASYLMVGLSAAPRGLLSWLGVAGRILAFFAVPMLCIWFPANLEYLDRGGSLFRMRSPRAFIWWLGWVALLMPVVASGLVWMAR